MTLTSEYIEMLKRIAVAPTPDDRLADHCTIDRKFLSEIATLALRGVDKMPRPISEADKSTTIQAWIGTVWRQADWDESLQSWMDEWFHCIAPTHFVVLETP